MVIAALILLARWSGQVSTRSSPRPAEVELRSLKGSEAPTSPSSEDRAEVRLVSTKRRERSTLGDLSCHVSGAKSLMEKDFNDEVTTTESSFTYSLIA